MIEQNGIPLLAVIMEPIIAISMFINGLLIYQKAKERQSTTTRMLSLSIFSYALAALTTGIGKSLQFFLSYTSDEINFSGFTIILAYCFTAIGNIFTVEFIAKIFRDGESRLTIIFTTLNGITLGFFIPSLLIALSTENVYSDILLFLVWHVFISLYIYFLLAYYGFKEARLTDQKIPKIGFKIISLFGISVALLFIFFVIDIAFSTLNNTSGYSIYYYLGWIFGAVASILAYIGYVMPNWVKKILIR